ncbi:adhesion G protein-coupled receptor E5-like [Ptychodera flava]|uniref:adhesion G protein-coupled receptor E5-like n=1 Tax=Ptychodera flava TaxID=63121 RepID=UPI00396A9590
MLYWRPVAYRTWVTMKRSQTLIPRGLTTIMITQVFMTVSALPVTNFNTSNPNCSSSFGSPDHAWDFSGRSDAYAKQQPSACSGVSSTQIYENDPVYKGPMTGTVEAGGLAVTLVDTYPSNQRQTDQSCAVMLEDDYVNFGVVSSVCLGDVSRCTSGFSLSMWLRYNLASNPTTERFIFTTGGHTPSGRGFSVSVESIPDPRIVFQIMTPATTSGYLKHLVYRTTFPDDTWFHAVFVYDNSSNVGTIYIDGLPASMHEETTDVPDDAFTATDFYVGSPNDNSTSSEQRATVAISDLYVYYRTLDATEARDLHKCQNPGALPTTDPPSSTAPASTMSTFLQLQDIHNAGEADAQSLFSSTLSNLKTVATAYNGHFNLEEMKLIADILALVTPVAAKDATMIRDFIEVCSDVLESLGSDSDEDEPQVISFVTGNFMHLIDTFAERMASHHDCDNSPVAVETSNIDLKVECAVADGVDDSISQAVEFTDQATGYTTSIVLPVKEIQAPVKVAIMVYTNLREHISNKALVIDNLCVEDANGVKIARQEEMFVGSDVTSFIASSELGAVKQFGDKFAYIQLRNDEPPDNSRAVCGHWKFYENGEGGIWSNEGCVVVDEDSNKSHTTCKCSHLTNFAVLMQLSANEIPLSAGHSVALENLTYICSVSSIFCLLMTLGCYTYLRLWKSQRIILHANLAVSLAVAQTTYLIGIEAKPEHVCTLVAVLLHYFFTASFSWMLIEGANLYIKSVFVFAKEVPTAGLVAAGWGMPAIIVGIALGIRFEGYGRNGICWLSFEDGLIWAFAGPVIFVIVANAVILILVLRVFMTLKANADKTDIQRLRVGIRAIVMLQPLLGLTWLFGAFAINENTVIFQYLFIICNALQGVFIFVLHCAMNEEVKQAFLKKRRVKSSQAGTTTLSMRDTTSSTALHTKAAGESVKF